MLKSNKTPTECRICSADAFNTYYGVKSCEPCKVFFKRNALNPTKLKCDFNHQCQINISNRHICSCCRLKKCFEVGMSPQMIRGPQARKTKNISPSFTLVRQASRENTQSQKFTTLSLFERDQSLLSTDDWSHLSNLIHSYDEHNALSIAKDFTKELDSLPLKLRFKMDSTKVIEIITTFCQVTEPFILSNQDFASLSFDDRSVVLHGAIDNVSCLGGTFLLRQSDLITNLAFRQALENTYGTIPYNSTLTIVSRLDYDITMIKLTLSLFAFCTSSCTLFNQDDLFMYITDYRTVLRIQDMYAELIWKYLLYRYTFDRAVGRFCQLVQCLILALTVRTQLQTVRNHTDVRDTLIQKIEQQQMDINNN